MKRCNKCGKMKRLSKFHKNKVSPDGRKYTCSMCISENYYLGSGVNGCRNCVFLRECRHNIRLKTFDPYCFVTARYHGLYQAEYRTEVTA